MPLKVEEAMVNLIQVFHSYSGQEGNKYQLNKRELRDLLKEEFDFDTAQDPTMVEKIMKELDDNLDGEVDFQEFIALVAALTVASNNFFMDFVKSQEQRPGSKQN